MKTTPAGGSAATATADVWSTKIGKSLTAKLIDVKTGRVVASKTFTGSAYEAERLTGKVAGNRSVRLVLEDASGKQLLAAEKAVDASMPDDTTAPTTTAAFAPSTPAGDTIAITKDSKITLSATDDLGVGSTEYRVDGGVWTVYSGPFSLDLSGGGHVLDYRSTDVNGNVESARSQALTVWPTVGGGPSGTVPATLALTLGAPAQFGAFTPGVARVYEATTSANVISTAGHATLSVSDPGHLMRDVRLAQPLQVLFSKSAWTGPVSNDPVTITFRQPVGANDPLRTGGRTRRR